MLFLQLESRRPFFDCIEFEYPYPTPPRFGAPPFPPQDKMDTVCREMYRAAAVEWSPEAEEKVAFYEQAGYGEVGCWCCFFCGV